ncbi:hypothetical protein JMJ77_0008198 [Colletotrichum scovillei]|uniref:Uncharacterized protein n=1 Tax=Colletotrichum scovillei TaxID=1209932 RepID=A0A9P7UJH5_9PEZI|nr:hypothetical protein JMJ77_0008198 [Colletotrichum scovillei]KAG7075190.1 hypothetical protein JMJ76_0011651 [Colletotrichum scovillei]KAG7082166.1 hypothetical protein JMJ78_0004270 [Colletotrichum scovillei]
MQLINFLFVTAMTITSVNAGCMIAGSYDPNCCWGGKDNVDACNRQGACNVGGDTDNYCAKFGITPQQCVSSLTSYPFCPKTSQKHLSNMLSV